MLASRGWWTACRTFTTIGYHAVDSPFARVLTGCGLWLYLSCTLVQVHTPEEEALMADAVAVLKQRFAVACEERHTVREFHFDQLSALILPPHVKFLLWIAHQPSEWHEGMDSSPAAAAAMQHAGAKSEPHTISGKQLWDLLARELSLSSDQHDKLKRALLYVKAPAAHTPCSPTHPSAAGLAPPSAHTVC